uniref:Uncharacterized protein n=1 Tax=Ditylenchus dipsaci TaxID=166011 RepID=A0A915CQT0_9BILA
MVESPYTLENLKSLQYELEEKLACYMTKQKGICDELAFLHTGECPDDDDPFEQPNLLCYERVGKKAMMTPASKPSDDAKGQSDIPRKFWGWVRPYVRRIDACYLIELEQRLTLIYGAKHELLEEKDKDGAVVKNLSKIRKRQSELKKLYEETEPTLKRLIIRIRKECHVTKCSDMLELADKKVFDLASKCDGLEIMGRKREKRCRSALKEREEASKSYSDALRRRSRAVVNSDVSKKNNNVAEECDG